ncbi:hypothetical protein [Streptomyces sp. NPDC047130]|uniref:hypothetical protein n=1 Tax=Streptomyces sp. NPDC047130 TaxID=3155261 RepID=UPI0033E8CD03
MRSRHVRAVAVLVVVVLALTGARGSRGGGCDGGSSGSSSHGGGSDDSDHDTGYHHDTGTEHDTGTDYDDDYHASSTGGTGSGSSATSTPTAGGTDRKVSVTDCVVDEIGLRGTVIVDNRAGEHASYTVTVEFTEEGTVVGKAVDHLVPMNTEGYLKSAVSADYEGPGDVERERPVDCEVTDQSTRE